MVLEKKILNGDDCSSRDHEKRTSAPLGQLRFGTSNDGPQHA